MSKHPRAEIKLLDPALVGPALRMSLIKLDPRVLARNPVMFVTGAVALLSTLSIFASHNIGVMVQITAWLWFTVFYENSYTTWKQPDLYGSRGIAFDRVLGERFGEFLEQNWVHEVLPSVCKCAAWKSFQDSDPVNIPNTIKKAAPEESRRRLNPLSRPAARKIL